MTLAFGPMKPVGLTDPKTGRRPFAVVQLRKENQFGTAYNMVGFQTKMKYGEQRRVFSMLPGLEKAEFLRLGSLHRNTYLDSPKVLLPDFSLRSRTNVYIAGQLTGTEGYLESCASGLLSAINARRSLLGKTGIRWPHETMIGSLVRAITDKSKENFQPLNANFGIIPPLINPPRDKSQRKSAICERAIQTLTQFLGLKPIPQVSGSLRNAAFLQNIVDNV